MKITFILNETGISGGIRVALHFADELRRRRHDVRIVSLPWPKAPRWRRFKWAVKRQIKAVVDWRGTLQRLLGPKTRVSSKRTASHLDSFPPFNHHQLEVYRRVVDADVPDADVVIATWWETALMVADLAPNKGAKISFFQQYDANFMQPEHLVEAAWRLPANKIVCSQWLADLAAERFGDFGAVVVNNGIDLDLFDAPPRGKQSVPTVGVMYSCSKPKEWPTALAVLTEVQRRLPNLRILAFGSAPPFPARPLPADAEFELLPDQSRLRHIYAQLDAWLCTSSSEGFHLTPHEAMACRTPVVSTRVGGPMDMIVEGINGYLTEPFENDRLVNRLVEVLTMTEERWRSMSDEAYATARSYTWDRAADRFEAVLIDARDKAQAVAACQGG